MSISNISGQPSVHRAQIGAAVTARLAAEPRAVKLPSQVAEAWKLPGYLDPATCKRLVAMIDANRRPSTLLSDSGGASFRTSESCDMDRHAPDIKPIDDGLAALLGFDPACGETMQGQRYAAGQYFRAHNDYFHEGETYWPAMKASGGQRVWTAMIFLNDVDEGGATWFPQAGVRVAPKRGLLLAWNNMKADGSPNPMTLHEGTAVLEGTKYIITKWFREARWEPAA
ncbi:prolyl hydroxylase family protein [Sphingomonas radiodurans]|uniref:prolyl hydroxylase family protein n=1 Tax=Sphingomonas radiodurans TaxID=2890321 RepID=UPI001E43AE61|nr:2OG-Fe(II) oxygenase [Sphingomonas radiodurans]WBH17167.1 2OG-Fe(II) oxygenase [Sphingomonas radiodurans]